MPGPVVSEVSRGCHRLIQQGAGLVLNAADVLAKCLGLFKSTDVVPTRHEVSPASNLSALAALVLERLSGYGQDLDEISALVSETAHATSLALVESARRICETEWRRVYSRF